MLALGELVGAALGLAEASSAREGVESGLGTREGVDAVSMTALSSAAGSATDASVSDICQTANVAIAVIPIRDDEMRIRLLTRRRAARRGFAIGCLRGIAGRSRVTGPCAED
jgi:hypothetical protein